MAVPVGRHHAVHAVKTASHAESYARAPGILTMRAVTVTDDAESDARRVEEEAERQAKLIEEQADRDAKRFVHRLMHDAELQQEWIRQDDLIYGGLMGIGIVMVQPFLTAPTLDTSATICVIAFAIAIPLLAALIMVNRHEIFRRRRTSSRIAAAAKAFAQFCAFVGLVAGFWHIHWMAGAGVLLSTCVAIGVQSAGFTRLEATSAEQAPSEKKPSGASDADGSSRSSPGH